MKIARREPSKLRLDPREDHSVGGWDDEEPAPPQVWRHCLTHNDRFMARSRASFNHHDLTGCVVVDAKDATTGVQ